MTEMTTMDLRGSTAPGLEMYELRGREAIAELRRRQDRDREMRMADAELQQPEITADLSADLLPSS